MNFAGTLLALLTPLARAENALTEKEKDDGWILLFDGKTLNGWMTSSGKPSRTPPSTRSAAPLRAEASGLHT